MVDPDTAKANAASRPLPEWAGTVDDNGKAIYRMDGETRRQIAATPANIVTITVRRFLDIEDENGSRDPGLLQTQTSASSSLDSVAAQLERAADWYAQRDEGRSVHRMAFAARIARSQADLLRSAPAPADDTDEGDDQPDDTDDDEEAD